MSATPGPWHVIPETGYDRPLIQSADGGLVADMCGREDDAETQANARLIAAAPELLHALRLARGYVSQPKVLERIDALVAKVVG